MIKSLFVFTFLVGSVLSVYDIMQFGAIPHSDNVKDHFINQNALNQAFKAANMSTN